MPSGVLDEGVNELELLPTCVSTPVLMTPVVLVYHWYERVPVPEAVTDIDPKGPLSWQMVAPAKFVVLIAVSGFTMKAPEIFEVTVPQVTLDAVA